MFSLGIQLRFLGPVWTVTSYVSSDPSQYCTPIKESVPQVNYSQAYSNGKLGSVREMCLPNLIVLRLIILIMVGE
jgi:hypothetical protein